MEIDNAARSGTICSGGTSLNLNNGACECPAGTELLGGQCVASCGSNQTRNAAGQCETNCETYSDEIQITQPTGKGFVSPNQCVGGCGYTLVEEINNPRTGNNCTVNSNGTSTCAFLGKGSGQHCTASTTVTTSQAGNTPQATPTSTTTTTTAPTTTTPAGTVPTQSGTTVSVSESSSTKVNSDGTVTTTTTTTTTTINPDGSTSTSTRTGTSTEQGGSGKGLGSGDGTGTGEGEGGDCDPTSADYLNCMAGEQTPTEHTHGESASFGDALSNFQDGIKTTPIGGLASAAGIGGTVNVGSCPMPSFDAFNRTYVIDAHCEIYDAIGPLLTSVMHVIFVVWGILIILSA